jgi:hypothetical protein
MDRRLLAVGTALLVVVGAPVSAQDPSPAAGGWAVLAQGLDAPRGIAIAPDGTLYVIETGEGGPVTVATPRGDVRVGSTAAISAIADGTATRVVEGLPSVMLGQEVLGPADLLVAPDGGFVVPFALDGGPEMRASIPSPFGDHLGWLTGISSDGVVTGIADLLQWEVTNDPDSGDPGATVESNPNGVAAVPDGGTLVADAGGNDLLWVGPDGLVIPVAVFHPAVMTGPTATDTDAGDSRASTAVQAVPTSVAVGPDMAMYVGFLSGAPFPVGGASVVRVQQDGTSEAYATGFTTIIDLAFGRDGTLYVLEITHSGLLSGDPTGGLWSVPPGGGQPTLLSTDLRMPGGIAIGRDGTLYVTTDTSLPNGGSVVSWKP